MTVPEPPMSSPPPETSTGWDLQRIVYGVAGGLGAIILLPFLVGLILAFTGNLEATALRMAYFRDLFVIVLVLEGILILAAIAVLIVQVSRMINLLKREARPILTNIQETTHTARGTVEFVGKNVSEPVIKASSFVAGASVFIREIGGIRRALRKDKANDDNKPTP